MPRACEGKVIENHAFRIMKNGHLESVMSDELLKGKKVILFGLPGAFTPTCSNSHVPRFNQLASHFKAHGIDDVACVAVNDAYVLDAWAKTLHATNIRFLADCDGSFTRDLGMLVDKSDAGLGQRSWRYSMLVENCQVKKMFAEPEQEGDPYTVSDADTMLRFLDPASPEPIALFAREGCPYCARAEAMLDEKGWPYETILLGNDVTTKSVEAVTGKSSVPQVFIGGKRIGGCDELGRYLQG